MELVRQIVGAIDMEIMVGTLLAIYASVKTSDLYKERTNRLSRFFLEHVVEAGVSHVYTTRVRAWKQAGGGKLTAEQKERAVLLAEEKIAEMAVQQHLTKLPVISDRAIVRKEIEKAVTRLKPQQAKGKPF